MNRHYYERMQEKLDPLKAAERPEPIRSDGAGALDLGPRDTLRDGQSPDILVPPATDHGLLPNLKFSFSDAHMDIKPRRESHAFRRGFFGFSSAEFDLCHFHLQ